MGENEGTALATVNGGSRQMMRQELSATEIGPAQDSITVALAEQSRAEVEARIASARRWPRSIMRVRERLLADCQRPRFAEAARYRKPVGGGQTAEGWSVRFSEACATAIHPPERPITKIYSYGARWPIEGAAIVRAQLEMAHNYQVDLVAIERDRDKQNKTTVRTQCSPAAVTAADRASFFASGWARMAAMMRSDGRAPKRGASPIAKRVEQARERERAAHRALWSEEKEARRREDVKASVTAQTAAAFAAAKAARGKHGTPGMWPSKGLVADAMDSAKKRVMDLRFGKVPGQPANPTAQVRFPERDGGGRVGGQPGTTGCTVAEALAGTHTFVRIEMLDETASPRTVTKKDGRVVTLPQRQAGSRSSSLRKRALVWLRVESDGKAPVWAKIPVVMHRPLPSDGVIKYAWLLVRPVGPRFELAMQFTVATPDETPAPLPAEPRTVAVNFGWRQLRDGRVRVGYAVGSDGKSEQILALDSMRAATEHADSLRSIRDRNREAIVGRLRAYASTEGAPDGLRRTIAQAAKWRGPKKLLSLLARWPEHIASVEERVTVEALAAWAQQDRHLHFWEADERAKAARRRRDDKDGYRAIAKRLRAQYDRVVVTDMQVSHLKRKSAPEEAAASEGQEQRRRMGWVAPAELGAALKAAFGEERYTKHVAVYATRTCPSCGVVDDDDARFTASERVTCSACGEERDQDESHCGWMLRRVASGEVVWSQASPLAPTVDGASTTPKKKGRVRRRVDRSQTTPQPGVVPVV